MRRDHSIVLPQLLTPGDVAAYLGVPTGTLANWRYQGVGPPFVHVGRLVRYRAEDVDTWIQLNRSDAGFPANHSTR